MNRLGLCLMPGETNEQREKSAKFVAKIKRFCQILSSAAAPPPITVRRIKSEKQSKSTFDPLQKKKLCDEKGCELCSYSPTLLCRLSPFYICSQCSGSKTSHGPFVTSVYLKLSHILSQSAVLFWFKCQIQSIKKQKKKNKKRIHTPQSEDCAGGEKKEFEDFLTSLSLE